MTHPPDLEALEAAARAALSCGRLWHWYPNAPTVEEPRTIVVDATVIAALVAEVQASRRVQWQILREIEGHGHIENHGHRRPGSACGVCQIVNELESMVRLRALTAPGPGAPPPVESIEAARARVAKEHAPAWEKLAAMKARKAELDQGSCPGECDEIGRVCDCPTPGPAKEGEWR